MEKITELAKKEIARLEKLNKKVDKQLIDVPEGSLKWQNIKGKIYYYHQYIVKDNNSEKNEDKDIENNNVVCKTKIEYIKKDSTLAKDLANKQYNSALKSTITNNLKCLKLFVNKYNADKLDNIYDNLSEARKKLVIPLYSTIKEKVRAWSEEEYETNNNYPANLRYETEQGDMVRSKSEVIIANILYKHREDILYKYEKPLMLIIDGREKQVYPDFTIINVHTGKITYWEHAGIMDDEHYATKFVRKMNVYVTNGLIPGKDVIVSYETQELPLDIKVVNRLVETIKD